MIWNFDPLIFSFLPIRWYGVIFALGFLLCLWVFDKMLHRLGNEYHQEVANKFLIFAMIGTVLGARLGHVFFYQWDYYSTHLWEIVQPWKGGLASHGGVVGMLLVIFLFIRIYGRRFKLATWPFLDALIVPALLMSSLIRFGNFCNSEIVGIQTQSDKGVLFCGDLYNALGYIEQNDISEIQVEKIGVSSGGRIPVSCRLLLNKPNEEVVQSFFEKVKVSSDHFEFDNRPILSRKIGDKWEYSVVATGTLRYPAQLYESAFYLLLFICAYFFYPRLCRYKGLCFSLFLGAIFAFRFFVEFIKMEQVVEEKEMILNIGQQLSIPIVLACVIIAIWRWSKYRSTYGRSIS